MCENNLLSVVCCYNNEDILNQCLLKTLEMQQGQNYELHLVDNRKNIFANAPAALNSVKGQVKGKYVMFVHQDICFKTEHDLADLVQELDKCAKLGIAGVAGCVKSERFHVYSNITMGNIHHPNPAGTEQIAETTKAQTLDECLLVIPNELWQIESFEERLSFWHLYGVEYSLRAQQLDRSVYIIPLRIHHMSEAASFDHRYYIALEKLFDLYRKREDLISTTVGTWHRKPKGYYYIRAFAKWLKSRLGR